MKYILIIFFLYATPVDSWGVPALENGEPLVYDREDRCRQAAFLLKNKLENEYRLWTTPTLVIICPPEIEWYKFDKEEEGYAHG